MIRWFLLFALALVSAGCRAPGNVYAPYGPTCVPPPGTGAVGTPYYQAPYQAPAYGGYPAGTVPSYQAPAIQSAPAYQGSRSVVPGGPMYAGAAPVTISPYMANAGAWNSQASYPNVAPAAAATVVRSNDREPIQPRPSGELIASGARFNRNEDLPWGSQVQQASAAVPYAATAEVMPSVASAGYVSPVRPSFVRPDTIYAAPVEYAAPTYPNDYVLDPYASTYGPYATDSVGSVATSQNWTPRR